MSFVMLICARCADSNHPSTRFCTKCGLPLGSIMPDAKAGHDALGPYEAPEPADPDTTRLIHAIVSRSGFEASLSLNSWRLIVPLPLDRRQAVYLGFAGNDPEGRTIVSLVSVCAPVDDRHSRNLLKMNSRLVEGHFAIKNLRGEDYFVVIENLAVDNADTIDAASLVRRIAETADGLEDRLSRGLDLY